MNITVYCGAAIGHNPQHKAATIALGKWIAQSGYKLVYGGGKAGLMGVIADTVLENGGEVIGVMPGFLRERELAHPHLTQLIEVSSMPERKLKMIELGNAYIALPGGPGTLEEISEVVSWARIGKNANPCIFFNSDNYYQPLQAFFMHMVQSGYLTQTDYEKILFSDNLDEMEKFIANYQPPTLRQYD